MICSKFVKWTGVNLFKNYIFVRHYSSRHLENKICRRLARCLLPAFLCAHVLKRDVWVRGSHWPVSHDHIADQLIVLLDREQCSISYFLSNLNRRAFCMRMRQYGLLKCHRGIFCELFTFSTSIFRLFSGAEWRVLDATFHKHVI